MTMSSIVGAAASKAGRPSGAWTGPLLFADGNFTNASARSLYETITPQFVGPFAGGTLAEATIAAKLYGQFEEARTNEIPNDRDLSTWTLIGGAGVTTDDANDPEGNATADTLTFGAAATDGVKLALATLTDDKVQQLSVFVKTAAGTKDFRIGFLTKANATDYSADQTATTTWQRFDHSVDIGNGGTTPEVRIINDVGGNAGSILVAFAQDEDDAAFPSSIVHTSGAAVLRTKDQFYWDAVDLPEAMLSGTFAFKWIPFYAHDEPGVGQYFMGGAGTDYMYYSNSDYKIHSRLGGGTEIKTAALTFARYTHMTITLDAAVGSITIAGADSGNGTTGSNPWTRSQAMGYGSGSTAGLLPINGLLSEPYAP